MGGIIAADGLSNVYIAHVVPDLGSDMAGITYTFDTHIFM